MLNILIQRRRNKAAARNFLRKLLKPAGFTPKVIIIDKLKRYGAKKEMLQGVEHRQHQGLNNRAENSHRPTRIRERSMGRFKSVSHAQRFLSAFEPIQGDFYPHQHKQTVSEYRETLCQRIDSWHASYGRAMPSLTRVECIGRASHPENRIAPPGRNAPNRSALFCPGRIKLTAPVIP